MSKQSKPKPSPLKFVGSEEEELLSSCSSSRRSSHGSLGNLARLASRRSSLSPKLLEKKREEDFGKRSGGRRRNSNFLELPGMGLILEMHICYANDNEHIYMFFCVHIKQFWTMVAPTQILLHLALKSALLFPPRISTHRTLMKNWMSRC